MAMPHDTTPVRTRLRILFLALTAGIAGAAGDCGPKPLVPEIGLSSPSVLFEGVQGGVNPTLQTVLISNVRNGQMDGLEVGAINYGSELGWLQASLDHSTAPATLTLQAITGSLEPNASGYTAQVLVQSRVASNSPQAIAVTFRVAAQPSILPDPLTITFNGGTGAPNPAAQTVRISNGGGGTLGGLTVGTIDYKSAATGWLTASLDGGTAPATLTLQAATGSLGVGSYNADVPVYSNLNTNISTKVAVRFVVGDGTAPVVMSFTPGPTRGFAKSTKPSATFSEPMDPATVNATSFTVGSVDGSVSLSDDHLTATFTPAAPLANGTDYTVTIKSGPSGVADASGNRLAEDLSWTFRVNDLPVASAGNDLDVTHAAGVTLGGSATDADGQPLTYSWTQVSGPDVGPLSGATPSFTAPDDIVTLQFDLVAFDGVDQSAPDRVVVWVLEQAGNAIWVDQATGTAGGSGTRAQPKATIAAAITAATASGADIYVTAGTYLESPVLASRVSIYGGFAPGSFLRDIAANVTLIDGGTTAIRGTNINNVAGQALTLDGLSIRSAVATAGGSSVGIALSNGDNVTISRNKITARAGAAGAAGSTPSQAAAGAPGQSSFNFAGVPGGGGPGFVGGTGGNGEIDFPTLGCFNNATSGSAGGGPFGTAGGAANNSGGNGGSAANVGSSGALGAAPSTAGLSFGSVTLGAYIPAFGSAGGQGAGGSGGGGGGGGGCLSFLGNGGGGGGGGAGGAGGGGGAGGAGGGGSFGILVTNGSTGVKMIDNTIATGNGGAGGTGAVGGLGGVGGAGGSGDVANAGDGGRGGNGGTGGRGGGGSGGGGGPTIAIVEDASSTTNLSPANLAGNTFTLGNAGAGGAGSGSSPAGAAGLRREYEKRT